MVRPAAKSRARTAASNTRSHSAGVRGGVAMAALCGGGPTCQSGATRTPRCGMLRGMPPVRRPLRVLHTADVHLHSDGYGTASEQAAHLERGRRVFRRIV